MVKDVSKQSDDTDGYLTAVSLVTGVPPGVLKMMKEKAQDTLGIDINAASGAVAEAVAEKYGIDLDASGIEIAQNAAAQLGINADAAKDVTMSAVGKVGEGAKFVGTKGLEFMKEQLKQYSNYFK